MERCNKDDRIICNFGVNVLTVVNRLSLFDDNHIRIVIEQGRSQDKSMKN